MSGNCDFLAVLLCTPWHPILSRESSHRLLIKGRHNTKSLRLLSSIGKRWLDSQIFLFF